MTETPVPWADNQAARLVLNRLRARGSATTVELQSELPLVHVARQVWELRHWYGHAIRTRRLPNGVALYILDADAPVGAGHAPEGSAAMKTSPGFPSWLSTSVSRKLSRTSLTVAP